MTIHEFAEAIGVSPTTISRAIQGRGRISPATRRMVLERMKDLGYTPNLNAQRLSHGRTYLVALDFDPWRDYLSDLFFIELIRGVRDFLEARGYGVLLNGPNVVLDRWVKTRAVDGVILMGNTADKMLPRNIASLGTPCVVIGNQVDDPSPEISRVGQVVVNLQRGAQQAAQLLVERGHRQIGFIATDTFDGVFHEFRRELDRLGAPLAEDHLVQTGQTPHDGAQALCDLLARRKPPTAVFVRTDAAAIGALRAAHRMGVRVPQDLSLIGHDDVPFAELTEPPLTTVRVPSYELARLAADMLFSLLSEPDVLVGRQVVPTELVVRDSVSAPRLWSLAYHGAVRPVARGNEEDREPV